jgi:hypothetical protein
MAHYAFLDENNIVTEVITGVDETELIEGLDAETWYGNFRGQVCKRTSYNTIGNVHKLGKQPFRKNYAGIGFQWDGIGFFEQQPFPSWVKDEETYLWNAPTAMPENQENYDLRWDEDNLKWIICL